jgi:hypothetical protein
MKISDSGSSTITSPYANRPYRSITCARSGCRNFNPAHATSTELHCCNLPDRHWSGWNISPLGCIFHEKCARRVETAALAFAEEARNAVRGSLSSVDLKYVQMNINAKLQNPAFSGQRDILSFLRVKLINRVEKFQNRLDRPIFNNFKPTPHERIEIRRIRPIHASSALFKHPSKYGAQLEVRRGRQFSCC